MRRIWLTPDCSHRDVGWSSDNAAPDCEECGAKAVAYIREDIADGMLAEATKRSVALITFAHEFAELLRDYWACHDMEAMTLLLAAILSGIQSGWMKNPPGNGITYSATFPEAGRLTISIQRTDGKSPAQMINERDAEIAVLQEKLAEASKRNATVTYHGRGI